MIRLLLAVGALLLTASPVAAQSTTWRTAVVIVGAADCNGVVSTTTPAMHALAVAETAEAAGLVSAWSSGAVTLDVTIIDQPALTLNPLSPYECWPGDIQSLGYDSTLILWPAPPIDPTFGPTAAGRAYASVTADGTHGTAVIPDGDPLWDHDLAQVMVHEWLHGSLAWVAPGFDLHSHDAYGYVPDDPAWFAAVMGNGLPDCAGLTADEWAAAGTPTLPGTGPISACSEVREDTSSSVAPPVFLPDNACEYFAPDGSQPIPEGYVFVNGDPDQWVGPPGCTPYVEALESPEPSETPTFALPDTAVPVHSVWMVVVGSVVLYLSVMYLGLTWRPRYRPLRQRLRCLLTGHRLMNVVGFGPAADSLSRTCSRCYRQVER